MKKRIIILVVSLIAITGMIVGVSYAFYSYNRKQEFTNNITSQCLKVEYKENSKAITLNYAYPIEDEKGYESKPYNFTFTNVCEDLVSYKINLEVLETSTLEEEYLNVILDLNEVKKLSEYEKGAVTLANAKNSYILEEGILSGGESITRNLRMWIDYDTTVEQGAK